MRFHHAQIEHGVCDSAREVVQAQPAARALRQRK
jgi:hypothetical protein